jgi:Protein of unknown function (DUF1688)
MTLNAVNLVADCAHSTQAAAHLRSTSAVRERAQALLTRARVGQSIWFTVNDAALAEAAALVAQVTKERYPDLKIPYHSRWRHFEAGGVDRKAQLDAALAAAHTSKQEVARTQIDLALVSVLLDAGSGPHWAYHEAATSQTITRSEGLGVASFHAFMGGLFSSDPGHSLRADAKGLQTVTVDALAQAFQVGAHNPLVGLEGRAALLRYLGEVLQEQPAVFGSPARPGGLFDHLGAHGNAAATKTVAAHDILSALLTHLSTIWPAKNRLDDIALGDCWNHSAVQGSGLTQGWMPFHKLSQWLTYSLLEPFEWAGIKVTGLDALTGLPEYRNGGLLLDAGVLQLRQPTDGKTFDAADECIVEWRALTVALLDELAPLVRQHLGRTAAQMPLACVLEGGTWAAGRALAQRLRAGVPPLNIMSDGTVF